MEKKACWNETCIPLLINKDTPNQSLLNSVKVTEKTHVRHSYRCCEMNSRVWGREAVGMMTQAPSVSLVYKISISVETTFHPSVLWLYVKPLHFSICTQNHNLPSLNFSQAGCPTLESRNSLPHSPKLPVPSLSTAPHPPSCPRTDRWVILINSLPPPPTHPINHQILLLSSPSYLKNPSLPGQATIFPHWILQQPLPVSSLRLTPSLTIPYSGHTLLFTLALNSSTTAHCPHSPLPS